MRPDDTEGFNEMTQNELDEISDVDELSRPETQGLLMIRCLIFF